ncbi:membrane protein [Sphingomonas hengshuiensis]|uniref:Membrane protein n=2 Tax=Sphingomonas hengshuiensis TaxID=1609977 RepID=A0A7U5BG21_9SPHN|nr:membrane protein [Sphingomonas hengshuiensis]
MSAFDLGAGVFLLACLPLLSHESDRMRQSAAINDANRFVLLLVTVAVSFVILVAVASELMEGKTPALPTLLLVIGTLALTWVFSNGIYALHYAHLFYTEDSETGGDSGGLDFPDTPEPDYWDFIYFAFCLGMTFQTSDVTIKNRRFRKVVTLHCLAAFVFNLGVIAFTINVLGG